MSTIQFKLASYTLIACLFWLPSPATSEPLIAGWIETVTIDLSPHSPMSPPANPPVSSPEQLPAQLPAQLPGQSSPQPKPSLSVHAKLDTGARTVSLHAENIELFSRQTRPWVRFSFTDDNNTHRLVEKPVVRTATIKRHHGKSQQRPVIMLDICLGTTRKTVEANLVDRGGLNYKLLLGRNYLVNDILVASAKKHLLTPQCDSGRDAG